MLNVTLNRTNRNRLQAQTHSLAQIMRNMGFQLHSPAADRAPTDGELKGMGEGCPERIRQSSLEVVVAEGIIHPRTGAPVLWKQLKVS